MNERERVNILIVDDQPAKLLSLETILADLDENILKASSADDALRLLLSHDIAVVLVDVCMPQMDGFSLAEMIRAHPRFRRTAILFISALALTDNDRLKAYDLGAVDYIPVPVVPEVLRAKVSVFIELFRKTDQLHRLNEELERRVAQRTADLEGTNVRLRESEERYRQLVQALPVALYACDAEGRITIFNPAAATLWGCEPKVGVDRWCGSWKLYTPDGEPVPMDHCPTAVCLREGRPVTGVEIVIERPDGVRRNVLAHPDPVFDASGRVTGAINMLLDVTDQRAGEAARSRLAAIVESSADAIVGITLDGIISSWNTAAEHMYGHRAQDVIGKSVMILIPEERRREELTIISKIRHGERLEHFETVRLHKDGSPVHVSLTVSPIRDASGRVTGASKSARDITERRRFERALRASEGRLRAIFGQAAVGIALTDLDGRFLEVNGRLCQIVRRGSDELRSLTLPALTHPEEAARVRELFASLIAGQRGEFTVEQRLARLDGSWVWVGLSVSPLLDENSRPESLVAIVEDITERKQFREELERQVKDRTEELQRSSERLRFAERMATIGTLSAGLGHDMGNLLLPVRLRLDAIEAVVPEAAREDVAAIRKAAEYLQRLAASLRLLSLDPERENEQGATTDLGEWWAEAEGMIRNGVPPTARLVGTIPPGLPRVHVGRAGVTQVLFNLVQNAGDALRGQAGGLIEVTAAPEHARHAVRVSVIDNGPGMSDEVRRRCLEPFFTTKTRAMSTGLGLALVSGIVKQAGGTLDITTGEGKGTRIDLVLPAAPSFTGGTPGSTRPGRGVAVVTLRDRRLQAYIEAMLGAMAYEVRRAPDPGDADVWVTESPDGEGMAAAHRFASARPQRRAVVFAEANGSSHADDLDGRIIRLEPFLKPSLLRTRILGALATHAATPA